MTLYDRQLRYLEVEDSFDILIVIGSRSVTETTESWLVQNILVQVQLNLITRSIPNYVFNFPQFSNFSYGIIHHELVKANLRVLTQCKLPGETHSFHDTNGLHPLQYLF